MKMKNAALEYAYYANVQCETHIECIFTMQNAFRYKTLGAIDVC